MPTRAKRRRRLQIADAKAKMQPSIQLVELIEIELVIATDTITNSPWEWDLGSLLAAQHSCGY
jgi:hypothetical protein